MKFQVLRDDYKTDPVAKKIIKDPLAYNRNIAVGHPVVNQETLPAGFKHYSVPIRKINGDMRFDLSDLRPPASHIDSPKYGQIFTYEHEEGMDKRMQTQFAQDRLDKGALAKLDEQMRIHNPLAKVIFT